MAYGSSNTKKADTEVITDILDDWLIKHGILVSIRMEVHNFDDHLRRGAPNTTFNMNWLQPIIMN